jgi:hypothetical protein
LPDDFVFARPLLPPLDFLVAVLFPGLLPADDVFDRDDVLRGEDFFAGPVDPPFRAASTLARNASIRSTMLVAVGAS